MNHLNKKSITWMYSRKGKGMAVPKHTTSPKNSIVDFRFSRSGYIISNIILTTDADITSANLYYNGEIISKGTFETPENRNKKANKMEKIYERKNLIEKELVFFKEPDFEIAIPFTTHIAPIIRLRLNNMSLCMLSFNFEKIPNEYIDMLNNNQDIIESVIIPGQKNRPDGYNGPGNNVIIMNSSEVRLKYPID